MVLLQDLSNLAEIPSTPVAFLELDLPIKACMLTAVVGLKLKTGQTTVSVIVLTVGCVSMSFGVSLVPMSFATFTYKSFRMPATEV